MAATRSGTSTRPVAWTSPPKRSTPRAGPVRSSDAGPPLVALALWACGPTWSDDVAPVVAERCASCHQDGSVAPFPLTTFADAAAVAPALAAAAEGRTMPPWLPDGSGDCGVYTDPQWLHEDEVAVFTGWVDAGLRPGDDAVIAEAPPHEGLADADIEVDAGVDYVPTALPDEHRCLIVDPELAETRFVTGFEVVPGDPEVVHHVIVYALGSADADAYAAELDAKYDGPGYPCVGTPGAHPEHVIGSWAPGTPAIEFPRGVGVRVDAGRKLVLQLHYHPIDGEARPDRTMLRLRTADAVPNEARVFPMTKFGMELAPGEAEATVTIELVPGSREHGYFIQGLYPHMHRRGRTLTVDVVRSGRTDCAMHVPRWNFDWQRLYTYAVPAYVGPLDTLRATCTYDTTDATAPIGWGGGTDDEMCLVGVLASAFP